MTGPHAPNPNFNFPPPQGPGNMPPQYNVPPQYPQPPYGNVPPQPQHPNQVYQGVFPPGFNPVAAAGNIWGEGHVADKIKRSARPPRDNFNALTSREAGLHPHERQARQKQKRAEELYKPRGSEQILGALPRAARLLGRVAFQGSRVPKAQRGPNHRPEFGMGVQLLAGTIGAIALAPAVVSKAALMPFRYFGNRALGVAGKDRLKPVVRQEGEPPRRLKNPPPAESVYTNPFPNLGDNLPISPKQRRYQNRQARKQRRQQRRQGQTPPAQQAQQPQAQPNTARTQAKADKARAKAAKQRRKKAGF